jgi:hypothetical protein
MIALLEYILSAVYLHLAFPSQPKGCTPTRTIAPSEFATKWESTWILSIDSLPGQRT